MKIYKRKEWSEEEALLALDLYLDIRQDALHRIEDGGQLSLVLYSELRSRANSHEDHRAKQILDRLERPTSDVVTALMEFVYLDPDTESRGLGNASPAIRSAWDQHSKNPQGSAPVEDDRIVALPPPELAAIKDAEERLSSITRELDEIIRLEAHMEGLEYHSLRNPQFKSDALKFQERLNEFLIDIAELKEKHSLQDLHEKAEHLKSVLDKDLENLDRPPVIRDSEPAKPAVQPIERPPKEQANGSQEESNANVGGSYLKILFNGDVHKAQSWEDVLSYIMYQIYYLEPSEFDHVMIKHIKYISTLRTRLSKPIKIMNTDYYVEGNLSESEIVSFCCELLKDDPRVTYCSVYTLKENEDEVGTVHLKLTPHQPTKPSQHGQNIMPPMGQEPSRPQAQSSPTPPVQDHEDPDLPFPENHEFPPLQPISTSKAEASDLPSLSQEEPALMPTEAPAEQPGITHHGATAPADGKATHLTRDLIEKVAADRDLISLQKAEGMQILNPEGIPMFYATMIKVGVSSCLLMTNTNMTNGLTACSGTAGKYQCTE